MADINELLDQYAHTALMYGGAVDAHEDVDGAWKRSEAARAAVDAEIQRMQSRISELEAINAGLHRQQDYSYIGKDGKAVKARDLEERVIELERENDQCMSAMQKYDMVLIRDLLAKQGANA